MGSRKTEELLIYGVHAVRAVFQKRPSDMVRVYVRQDRVATEGKMLRQLADQKKAYHVVVDEDLDKICKSVHHDGLAALIKRAPALSKDDFRKMLQSDQKNQLLVWIDGLENPHNIGAIVRSAAHFGIRAMILTGCDYKSLPAAAMRIAMGGSEFLPLYFAESVAEVHGLCKEHAYKIFTTSSHQGQDLYLRALPQRVTVVFGAESTGVSPALMNLADDQLCIKGTGTVESLNVSVAAALVMGEYSAQFR